MRRPGLTALVVPILIMLLVPMHDAHGQVLGRLKRAAQSAAESELTRKVDRLTREAVRCALGDSSCEQKARSDGKEVVYTDARGEIIKDGDGVPITDAAAAAQAAGVAQPGAAVARPGDGVWANYDFVPGETVLFYDDFNDDVVGDFPRRMEFVSGNWEVVEWEGRRLLRNTGPRYSAVKIILPRALPEHFTIEFDAYFPHSNYVIAVAPSPPTGRNNYTGLSGHFFQVGATGTGVRMRDNQRASTTRIDEIVKGLVPIRILADGRYARVYVNERRVANIPNADLQRSDELWIENMYHASTEIPLYIGAIRIAEGGTDLYRKLADEGRVATQGILFDLNSATIRPESTPTLEEIGTMLREHGDLRLRIEGHTDATGDDASNLSLSERRAGAVRAFLVEAYDIDASRLESVGLGETKPVGDNATPEGRQNNRRVELVKLN